MLRIKKIATGANHVATFQVKTYNYYDCALINLCCVKACILENLVDSAHGDWADDQLPWLALDEQSSDVCCKSSSCHRWISFCGALLLAAHFLPPKMQSLSSIDSAFSVIIQPQLFIYAKLLQYWHI